MLKPITSADSVPCLAVALATISLALPGTLAASERPAAARPQSFEGESLLTQARGAGGASTQVMSSFGDNWSGGAQLFWNGGPPGSLLELAFNVAEPAVYALELYLTRGPDYAQITFELDGQPLKATFDTYHAQVARPVPFQAGSYPLVAGKHTLGIKIDDKSAQSTGYRVGLDQIRLFPTAALDVRDSRTAARPVTSPAARTPANVLTADATTSQGIGQGGVIQQVVSRPALELYRWNPVTQQGQWTNSLPTSQPSKLKLRWKPAYKTTETGYWQLHVGAATEMAAALLIEQGKVELPGSGQEWREFELDLEKWNLKPTSHAFIIVRESSVDSLPVRVDIAHEKKQAAKGSVSVAAVETPFAVIWGPLGKDPDFEPGNHITVRFAYSFPKSYGGRIYPALLNESGTISPRNYWEKTEILTAANGTAESRMTIRCADTGSPVVRVSAVHYTVADADSNAVFQGVAKLPRTYVFRCSNSPLPVGINEVLIGSIPAQTSKPQAPPVVPGMVLQNKMSFHKSPDCDCVYGLQNLSLEKLHVGVAPGAKVQLVSYLLRENGEPLRVWNGYQLPIDFGGHGWPIGSGSPQKSGSFEVASFIKCLPPADDPAKKEPFKGQPRSGTYKITGIRVELRDYNAFHSNIHTSPQEMAQKAPPMASDTYPLNITVQCQQ